MTGGAGANTFHLASAYMAGDTITDFGTDVIQIINTGFNPSTFGIADLSQGMHSAVHETVNLVSSSGFRYLESTSKLFYGSDGGNVSSGGDLIATLSNKPAIETLNNQIQVLY